MSINIDEDIIDVFLLYNNKKVKSVNEGMNNYYRIICKDIGVEDNFKELFFVIVNNIELTINIKFKNKFSTQAISVKDRLKFFNQKPAKKAETQYIPNKLKTYNFSQKEESKKIEEKKENKKEEIKEPEEVKNKEEINDKREDNVKEEKQPEEVQNNEENNNNEEVQNNEEAQEEQNNEKVQNEESKNTEEVQNNEEDQNIENTQKVEETQNVENTQNDEKIQNNQNEEAQNNKEIKKEEGQNEEFKEKIKEGQKKEVENQQKDEVKVKEDNAKNKNIYKQNYSKNASSNEQNQPKKLPGKLKIPAAFLFQPKETPQIFKKSQTQIVKKDIKIEKEEKNNQEKSPIEKEEKLPKQIENESKPKKDIEDKKQPLIENVNNQIKKSKTSKESEISQIMKTPTNTLPSIEEKDDFIVLNENFEDTIKEIFLEPSTYGQFLKEQKDKGIKHPYRETFCEGFFIASFPQKDGKVIEMSESFPAPCKHEQCSKLPAMKPEIIFRYPLQDTKTLELNNLAATICFPTGIKVCYDESNGPTNIKDYVTSITNQKGERYYMMNYHFYLKLEIDEYQQYEEHPLKYNLRKFADAYTGLSEEELTEELINKIQENLEFCQELGFRDTVYVPFCICLISKYPYVLEMKKCLKSIYTILNQPEENSLILINDLIMYLIHAIPIPAKNTKVNFLIPYFRNSIEIDCPKLEDINIMNRSAAHLLRFFTIDNLILIFRLLITEKKILIIDEDYENLSKVADGFISILYPFQWIHTYIPIMSDQMLKYLETFLPFLNGINKSLMSLVENVFREGEVEEDDEVFLIYLSEEKDKIRLSSSLRGKKKKLDKYISDNIPSLPSALEKDLRNKPKIAKELLDKFIKSED